MGKERLKVDRKRWAIVTNKKRYVGVPFMLRSGFQSFLDDEPVWNKTRTFHTKEEAEEGLEKYLSPDTPFYVDRYSFIEGEELVGVEMVFV